MARKFLQYMFLTTLCACLFGHVAEGRRLRQEPDSARSILATHRDSLPAFKPDSIPSYRPDSLRVQDSIATARRDSLDLLHKSSLEQPA
ncbi:MAG: hypothetical protein J6P56_02000, partial [Bacteroidales bacterium]|nr:hypothetical protein [Bacteroidales bacterium]